MGTQHFELASPEIEHFINRSRQSAHQNKYGKVNYVTKNENGRLTKFQRVDAFTTPMKAYENAEIDLVKITYGQLVEVKKRNGGAIEEILSIS